MVPRTTIEKVHTAAAASSDEQLEFEFERFFTAQGEICDFVMDLTAESRQPVRELALYLSYVVYRAWEEERNIRRRTVGPDRIAAAAQESRRWLESLSGRPDMDPAALDAGPEPYLLGYVVSEVLDASAGGLELHDEETGMLFFTLKTVIGAFSIDDRSVPDGTSEEDPIP